MRKLVLVALLVVLGPRAARAEIGIGLFVGEPVGLDLKIDLSRQTALDIVLGATSFRDGSASYGHLTYLFTPFVGRGSSILVPFRLGIGAAVYGAVEDDAHLAVRAPLQLGFRFRRTPVEIYLEIAAVMQLLGSGGSDFGIDGGLGVRFYF